MKAKSRPPSLVADLRVLVDAMRAGSSLRTALGAFEDPSPFADVGRALARQTQMYDQSRQFFEQYEYFILPVTQVAPFDVDVPYPTTIAGTPMMTYIDWMRVCSDITVTGLPAISVPCGFTEDGLPVGVQIVGRHQDEFGVLQLAHAFEQATGFWTRRPAVAA